MLQEAINRIRQMEQTFDRLLTAERADPASLRVNPALSSLLQDLTRYYEGGQWLRDYELDEKGCLPPELKRGVLSQDAVYDFLARRGTVSTNENRRTSMEFSYLPTKNPDLPYRLQNMPVFFSDLSCLDVIQAVLDEEGRIRNFPGLVKDERWVQKHRLGQCYDVRFEAQFYPLEQGEYLMLWMIQPNGWHWVDDDGFGFTGDSAIVLYSVTDKHGSFQKSFTLFSIDRTRYCQDFDQSLPKST